MDNIGERTGSEPLLSVRNLGHSYFRTQFLKERGGRLVVLSDVSFDIWPGEILGFAGESGAGKSTLACLLVGIHRPESGSIAFDGVDVARASRQELRRVWRLVQMVFQDPVAALDPYWTVAEIVSEPLVQYREISNAKRRALVRNAIIQVQLDYSMVAGRKPRTLSVGECQRVAIARAIACGPRLLICDEIVSALDPLTKMQIVDMLLSLRSRLGLSILFISHELALLHRISDRIAIVRSGRICEIGNSDTIVRNPVHSYTRLLVALSRRAQLPARTGASDAPFRENSDKEQTVPLLAMGARE